MKRETALAPLLVAAALVVAGCGGADSAQRKVELSSLEACKRMAAAGFRPIASDRERRFLGKVQPATAECRGGPRALAGLGVPWVDWSNYWGAGDAGSKFPGILWSAGLGSPTSRGVHGALMDLEYERMELIELNLFDDSGTYQQYVEGRDGVPGPSLKVWPQMRLPPGDPDYAAVGGGGEQLCGGELIRHRTLRGICNDLRNPLMGSAGQPFARNVQFSATFPRLGRSELVRNRHGGRIGLLTPDPQVISRKLFTRVQSHPERCNDGLGLPDDSPDADCDYVKAPFMNVLAAFWIQFMNHDWFSHTVGGHNQAETMPVGCVVQKVDGVERPLSPEEAARLGCRPADRMEKAYVAEASEPPTFTYRGKEYLTRAPEVTDNTVTAWWDASQLYGWDEPSRERVKRDPDDPAKLRLLRVGARPGAGEAQGYLPLLHDCAGVAAGCLADPMNPAWAGQEATAFPDNWTVGLSFFHNVFAREHNAFVAAFRRQAAAAPDADSGLRNPADPGRVIRYRDVTADELFAVARLVVAAEIAKIHTLEWTPQLLYDEPLYEAMNANWGGLFGADPAVSQALGQIVTGSFGRSENAQESTRWYSVFASGAGIVGLGSHRYGGGWLNHFNPWKRDRWSLSNPDDVGGGANHFGSPFNFPEEFVTVYRLHPMVPDLIAVRQWDDDPNLIRHEVPVVSTFRGAATAAMRRYGLADWALSLGRQRVGALSLDNHPRFLQDLHMPRLSTPTQQIDVAALDLIRDRERGVPRFNEFRRQLGLKSLTGFDDFVDRRLADDSPERRRQQRLVEVLREVYGQHRCDASKVITEAQLADDGSPITDCLGHPDGSRVDNVEDLDTVVGWLAESTRPHGFAISETQFVVFILNASRRLFSDRFFTSSFRPEFYSTFGLDWVMDNGPDGPVMEQGEPNGHRQPVSPLKRVLLRALPELAPELAPVVNVFDPWARDRGTYYSLAWTPRPGAEDDPAFQQR
jgi:Animal haem peroxidase